MIIEEEDQVERIKSELSEDYLSKKKAIENAFDQLDKDKNYISNIKLKYDPSAIIKKSNLENEKKIMENEGKAFKFLDEFCDIRTQIQKYENLNVGKENIESNDKMNEIEDQDEHQEENQKENENQKKSCPDDKKNVNRNKTNIMMMDYDIMENDMANSSNFKINENSHDMEIDSMGKDKSTQFKKTSKNTKKRNITSE